jgi:hypothetical protein
MSRTGKKVVLNRAVFVQRPLDSSELSVLATLFHRFPVRGDYEVFVRRDAQVVRRLRVRVEEGNAPNQIDIDLAESSLSASTRQAACLEDQEFLLKTNGVIAFYASQGIERYTVSVTQDLREKRLTLLDSRKPLPEGDLFAVTLVRPGAYRVVNLTGKAEGQIQVSLPPREKYRADQVTLVECTKEGFQPREVSVYSGQSVAFHCRVPAQIRVEPARPPDAALETGEKRRLRITRPRANREGK